MRKIGVDFIVAGVLLTVGAAVYASTKYDEWFEFPKRRAYVNKQLKDPASTIYRNEQLKKSGWLCGELNSKNSMGGYVGFKRYMAGSADDAYLEEHGHIGVDSTAQASEMIIEELNVKIKMHEAQIAAHKLGESISQDLRLSESDIHELAVKRVFDRKWKEICE